LNPGTGPSDVIAVGGANNTVLQGGCQRYNASANVWTSCGTLPTPVFGHTATLCTGCPAPRNGKVIVTGGATAFAPGVTNAIQRFEPSSNSWVADGTLPSPLFFHRASLRTVFGDSARLLIMGGFVTTGFATTKSALTWPPGGIAFSGNMINERALFGNGRLSDGRILVAGGYRSQSNTVIPGSELFTP
jgi:hypothetical protein